ncbi:MAG: 4-alpha-glucanotransferase, partial [Clostridia bacterium]|nr:4-alpha-glucanotransferase [Clostridia bacterium]
SWWKNRIKIALDTFDLVRIDHFRGLDRFYEIENGRPDATVGEWVQVPGKELFDEIKKEVGKDKIIAEDLGVMDDGVKELLNYTGFPGMKILSFAFSGETDNPYLPENIESNSVCYTGTHDNDTLKGLIDNLSEHELNTLISGVKRSAEILGLNKEVNRESVANVMVELGFKCKADTFVLPMQDVLGLGRKYRINEPGTVKNENWSVRLSKQDFSDSVSEKLKELNEKYNR